MAAAAAGAAAREGEGRALPAPDDAHPSLLTTANLVRVMDKSYTVKDVHEVLQKVKGKQSELEGAVEVTTRNSKEEILKGLVEQRVKGGGGVERLLRWLEEAKVWQCLWWVRDHASACAVSRARIA
eukprot:516262-Rhodomonas_salina.1